MFFIEPLSLLLGGYIGAGYEYFLNNGKSSIAVPFRIQVIDSDLMDANYYDSYRIGFNHKFFPTGSGGFVRGFIGYAEHFISMKQRYSYSYWDGFDYYSYSTSSRYAFSQTHFISGVQFHANELININLQTGVGFLTDFDDIDFSWDIGIHLGFRF